jgi:two-component system OmpR family sensor kinase
VGRLFWKIFLAFWVSLVVAAVVAGAAVWWHRHARDTVERELAGAPPDRVAIDTAAALLRHGGVAALRDWMNDPAVRQGVPLLAVDHSGRDLLGRTVPAGALERARQVAGAGATASSGPGQAALVAAAPGGEAYLLFVPRVLEPQPPAPPLVVEPWILALVGVASGLAASALLAGYLARPIRNLRWAFGAVAEGRLDTRVLPSMGRRRDEIADLGRDFDRMAQRLQALVAAQRRLLHDVSHELRSPLARLQAATGLLRQDPHKVQPTLERIEREITRLDVLIGELLELSRLEAGATLAGRAEVDLAQLVAEIAQDASFEAEARGRRVEFRAAPGARVRGPADLLHRAVDNVVRNAVKFTAAGTAVDVALQAGPAPRTALVSVGDRGPGVPADELERIFEPFYQSRAAAGSTGFGLGLAIARRAIAALGGTIRARNREGGGLRVDIELPLA